MGQRTLGRPLDVVIALYLLGRQISVACLVPTVIATSRISNTRILKYVLSDQSLHSSHDESFVTF